MGQIIRAAKTSKKVRKNVPHPDPEISIFSIGAPCFFTVAHLTHLAVAHHEAISGAVLGVPLLSQITMAHHRCATANC
jgi:hypothetical protein